MMGRQTTLFEMLGQPGPSHSTESSSNNGTILCQTESSSSTSKKESTLLVTGGSAKPIPTVENISYFDPGPSNFEDSNFCVEAGQTWIYPTNFNFRQYQFDIVQRCFYENTLVSLPTGLGKTFIAAVVLYNFYRWYPRGKCIFMAPTKPLVAQQIDACAQVMGMPASDCSQMTGHLAPGRRAVEWAEKRVFFLTPQAMQNDLTRAAFPAADVKCIIFDEAHKALGNHAYCQVVRELLSHSSRFRCIALTATPGNDLTAVQQVLDNLLISHVELRSDESPDVAAYSHSRNVEKIVVPLSEDICFVRDKYIEVLAVIVSKLNAAHVLYTRDAARLSKMEILRARERLQTNPPANLPRERIGAVQGDLGVCLSLYHGYELLLQYGMRSFLRFIEDLISGERGVGRSRGELLRNKGFCECLTWLRSHFNNNNNNDNNNGDVNREEPADSTAENSGARTTAVASHPKLDRLRQLLVDHFTSCADRTDGTDETRVIVFAQYRDSVQEIAAMLSQHEPLIRAMAFMGQGQGSQGRSSTRVTQKEQLEVVRKFRAGNYNTLVSTCVGEEGLDIGEVDLIICFDANKSPIRLIQRMGRTGRKRQGRVVILVTEGKEDSIYKKSLTSKNSIHKALISGCSRLRLYPNNPRMVMGQPRCEMRRICATRDQQACSSAAVGTVTTGRSARRRSSFKGSSNNPVQSQLTSDDWAFARGFDEDQPCSVTTTDNSNPAEGGLIRWIMERHLPVSTSTGNWVFSLDRWRQISERRTARVLPAVSKTWNLFEEMRSFIERHRLLPEIGLVNDLDMKSCLAHCDELSTVFRFVILPSELMPDNKLLLSITTSSGPPASKRRSSGRVKLQRNSISTETVPPGNTPKRSSEPLNPPEFDLDDILREDPRMRKQFRLKSPVKRANSLSLLEASEKTVKVDEELEKNHSDEDLFDDEKSTVVENEAAKLVAFTQALELLEAHTQADSRTESRMDSHCLHDGELHRSPTATVESSRRQLVESFREIRQNQRRSNENSFRFEIEVDTKAVDTTLTRTDPTADQSFDFDIDWDLSSEIFIEENCLIQKKIKSLTDEKDNFDDDDSPVVAKRPRRLFVVEDTPDKEPPATTSSLLSSPSPSPRPPPPPPPPLNQPSRPAASRKRRHCCFVLSQAEEASSDSDTGENDDENIVAQRGIRRRRAIDSDDEEEFDGDELDDESLIRAEMGSFLDDAVLSQIDDSQRPVLPIPSTRLTAGFKMPASYQVPDAHRFNHVPHKEVVALHLYNGPASGQANNNDMADESYYLLDSFCVGNDDPGQEDFTEGALTQAERVLSEKRRNRRTDRGRGRSQKGVVQRKLSRIFSIDDDDDNDDDDKDDGRIGSVVEPAKPSELSAQPSAVHLPSAVSPDLGLIDEASFLDALDMIERINELPSSDQPNDDNTTNDSAANSCATETGNNDLLELLSFAGWQEPGIAENLSQQLSVSPSYSPQPQPQPSPSPPPSSSSPLAPPACPPTDQPAEQEQEPLQEELLQTAGETEEGSIEINNTQRRDLNAMKTGESQPTSDSRRQPVIFVDSKEIASSPAVIRALRGEHRLRCDVCSGLQCDYVVGLRVGVIRVPLAELSSQQKRSKFNEKLSSLESLYERRIVIVEHSDVESAHSRNVGYWSPFTASLIARLVEPSYKMYTTASKEETARVLAGLAELELAKGFMLFDVEQRTGHFQEKLNFFLSLPGVHYGVAWKLSEEFKCMRDFFEVTNAQQLMDVTALSLEQCLNILEFVSNS